MMNSLVKSKLKIVALRIDNYIHFLMNGFRYIQKALKAILSKYDSKESLKSASYPSSGYRILTQKDFNREKVHVTENDLSFRASEKIQFIEFDSQNGTRRCIRERTIYFEMNKTEFWSVNSE